MDNPKQHLHDRVLVYAAIWILSDIGTLFAMKQLEVSREVGIVLTVINALAFALFIYKYYRSIFFMDELQVKVQMEAVVIAFFLGLLLIMTLGSLEMFIDLRKDDWSYRNLIPMFATFYIIGLFISKRKYGIDNE
jgi:hypothetical protein